MRVELIKKLLEYISTEREPLEILLKSDNEYEPVCISDITNSLVSIANEEPLEIKNKKLLTEGDILTILRIICSLISYTGDYILFINETNMGFITYIVDRANTIYESLNLNVKINIDYSKNYNSYLASTITLIGSEDFINTSKPDFINPELIYLQ